MKESVQPVETTATQKKANGLYVASVNRRMILEDAINSLGVQYSCRNVDTPDYSQSEDSFDENWMPAVLTQEEEQALYSEYY